MQLFAQDAESMDQAKIKIEKEAELKKVVISEGSGPAFDANILEESESVGTVWETQSHGSQTIQKHTLEIS